MDKTTIHYIEERIWADYKANCTFKAMESHKKTPFEIFFHYLLLLAVTIWTIPHLLTRVQALNFSTEQSAKGRAVESVRRSGSRSLSE